MKSSGSGNDVTSKALMPLSLGRTEACQTRADATNRNAGRSCPSHEKPAVVSNPFRVKRTENRAVTLCQVHLMVETRPPYAEPWARQIFVFVEGVHGGRDKSGQ